MTGWTPSGGRLMTVAATWVTLVTLARILPHGPAVMFWGGLAALLLTGIWVQGRPAARPRPETRLVWAVGALAYGLLLLTLLLTRFSMGISEWILVLGLPLQYLLLLRAGA